MRNTFRIIAIFVMCFMLVNIVMAPSASAIAFSAGTVVSVAAAALIPAMIVGLGLCPESSDAGYEAFSQLCSNVDTMLTDAGQAIDDRIDVIRYGGINYVSSAMLQSVKDWFFSSKTISVPSTSFVESNIFYSVSGGSETLTSATPIYMYYFTWPRSANSRIGFASVAISSSTIYRNTGSTGGNYYCSHTATYNPSIMADLPYVQMELDFDLLAWIESWTEDETLTKDPPGIIYGSVKPLPDTDIETNYETWIGIQFEPDSPDPEEPTEPSVPYFPIKIPEWTYTDPWTGYPDQQEIQNPSPTQEPEPDTPPDPTTDPDSSTDTDPSNPGASGDVSGQLPNMVIDLKDFFPFCIPFDIYKFLSILAADPVAPEFDLKLRGFNQDFVFHVDLSPFDGLAALVRAFELMGFIIGLGMVTRNKFLRG